MAQYEKRKKAVSTLKEIDTRPDNYIIVHYTCDNFKVSQIISSIAVRQLADGQTESFSLYKAAQEMNIENDVADNLPFLIKGSQGGATFCPAGMIMPPYRHTAARRPSERKACGRPA